MNIEEISFKKALTIYQKLFSLHYINGGIESKLACISLTCYITNELRKKGKDVTCYDVLLKIGKGFGNIERNGFFKSLGCLCEDLMYYSDTFPLFGVEPKNAPKVLKSILEKYVPF